MAVKIISRVFLVIFIFLIVTNFISGINSYPAEGDSLNYHIPIAKNILNGNFIFQTNVINIERWYPGSSEIILAMFIFFNIPLNLFNVFSICILFIVLYKFGKMFLENKDLSLIFSSAIVSTYGILRLIHTQNIDIWMLIYFLILIMLLEKPQNKLSYFLSLGFFSGMIIGSKYIGPLYFVVLFIFYFKNLIKGLNIRKIICFLIPFIIFGGFWYLRNLILTGSPFYPQGFLFFKGIPGWDSYLSNPVWKAIILTPKLMFNAFIQELMFWPIIFSIIPFFIIYLKSYKKKYNLVKITKFLKISLALFLIYLFLPYDNKYLGMVLTIRYILNIFVLLTLSVFMLSKSIKQEISLAIIVLANGVIIFFHPYHPKILFIYMPVLCVFLIINYFKQEIINKVNKFKANI